MKNELENRLKKILKTKEKPQVKIILNQHGDLASNALFIWAKENKSNPYKGWEENKEKLNYYFKNIFDKIEFENGYLNFFIKKDILFKFFKLLLKNKKNIFELNFFKSNFGHNQKIILEFVSANPTGPLHLGNGRNAILGEILSRILKETGFSVFKEYYNNNRGKQIETLGLSALNFLGFKINKEDLYRGDYLKELAEKNKGLCLKFKDQPEYLGYLLSKKILEFYIKPTLKSLNVSFDNFFSEKKLYEKLDKEVLNKIKKFTYEKDGALWLKLQSKDEVLIKKTKEPTYFFSDILYHYNKFKIRKFKYSINIFGADHLDHARRLKEALNYFGIKEKQLKFIIYQLVYVKKGESTLKMSKRKGDFVLLDDLIKEVGPDPIKFYFALHPPETHLLFDIDLAKKKNEENLYWYVVYTGARLWSILEKAKKEKIIKNFNFKLDPKKAWDYLKENDDVINILKRIYFVKDILIDISKNFQIQILPQYIVEISKIINSFYEKEKIIENDLKKTLSKLEFVYCITNALKRLFYLINIEFKEKV